MSTLQELITSPDVTGRWSLVANRSSAVFKAKSIWGLLPVKGKLVASSGEGEVHADGSAVGQVVFDVASLSTGIGKRDEHLRSADFFDAANFPEISVRVTEVRPTTGNGADLHADFTVRGTTRSIELPATIDALADGLLRISATTTVDRSEFGVTGNLVGMIGSRVTLSADTVFARDPSS